VTTHVENFPGFKEGILGPELMQEMRRQAERFGAEILDENVTEVDFGGKTKKVWVGEKIYTTKAVVITTGAKARMLKVGEEKLIGRGVSTCAVCDAAFFRGKKTVVVGGGDAALEDALALAKFASEVKLVHRRHELRASKIMQRRVMDEKKIAFVWDSEVVGVAGEGRLEGVKVKNILSGKIENLEVEGLFLAIGHVPTTEICQGKLELDEHGYLVTRMVKSGIDVRLEYLKGYPTMTNVEGVFGAGDVVDFRYRQAITAAAMGTQAALDVEKFLMGKK